MTREEAIEIIKRNCTSGSDLRKACELFIPELTENEDERIREELIGHCKDLVRMNKDDKVMLSIYEPWLAWLEKQKEQKPELPKPHKGDDNNPYDMQASEALEYAIKRGFGVPFNDGEVYVDVRHMTQTIGNIIRWADEHPKEQKPFNVCEQCPYYKGCPDYNEQKIAEWDELQADFRNINETFEDGKKEVVAHPEKYGLCKSAECVADSIKFDEGFKTGRELGFREGVESVKPAEWNEYDNACINNIVLLLDGNGKYVPDGAKQQCLEWFNQHRIAFQNRSVEWSKEDEKILNELLDYCNTANATWYNWLKSLRPQPKQELSEDNIKELTEFEAAMLHIGMSFFGSSAGLNPNNTNEVKKQAKLLLELVPKQEWSEEDEEMLSDISWAIRYCAYNDKKKKQVHDWFENRFKSLRPQIIDSAPLYTIEQVDEKVREAQEWSEEDEKMFESLHACVCRCINDDRLDYAEREQISRRLIPFIERLKSLRPQPKEQKPVEYLDKNKIYAIMKKLHDLSFSQDILINSKEYKQINEITHDVRSLLDYPIEPKPAEWSNLDKDILNDAITAVDLLGNDESFNKSNPNLANAFRVAKDWLETLPERFNVKEEKQEWTKEDENMLLKLLMMIDTANDYEEIRVWLCTKLNVVTSTELDRKLESDMTQLERYISKARTKKGFYWNNKEVSWEEIPLEERKHDYPYYFKNGLDCYPFRCLDDEGICIKID